MSDYPIEAIESKISLFKMHVEELERQQDDLVATLNEVIASLNDSKEGLAKWKKLLALVKEAENDL